VNSGACFSNCAHYFTKWHGACRTSELFDIIVDFPNSAQAVEELRVSILFFFSLILEAHPDFFCQVCLTRTEQRDLLVDSLKAQNAKRLLQPGADTKDVITQYVSTIKCLGILDTQGVLLSRVADPIRSYLR
jgi:anaphase-promoting complex subunit 2